MPSSVRAASRSRLGRQLQHSGWDSGAPALYWQPESRPAGGSPTPGGTGQPAFQANPVRCCWGPCRGCWGVTLWSVLGPAPTRRARGARYTGLENVAAGEMMPGGPAQGGLVAEHAGGLSEKVKQDEEPGSSFLLGAKSCRARDGHYCLHAPAMCRSVWFPRYSCTYYRSPSPGWWPP